MDDIPLSVLFGVLFILILLSAFFSGSETGLMALNRYRLRHLAKIKHGGAVRAQNLLDRPDRLIGLILLGNNFVNIMASSIAAVIGIRLLGEAGIVIAGFILTLVILIFSEVTPKTLAAIHPERIAFPASYIYTILIRPFWPLIWVINGICNSLLKVIGVSPEDASAHNLSQEELRTVVNEAGAIIPKRHQKMLLGILDLEQVTVEDIMVPRNEMDGIDLNDDLDEIRTQLSGSQYTRLPVYEDSMDEVVGILHVRKSQHLLLQDRFSKEELESCMHAPYFIPEGTPLNKQLLQFQRQKERIGLVVDEYGDIQGLVTMEDLLEEIVGEFTSDPSDTIRDVSPQEDGSFIVDGTANIRSLNRMMGWQLPMDGPKTLNGLIIEYLESIPDASTSLRLAGYPIDITQTTGSAVKKVRIYPELRKPI